MKFIIFLLGAMVAGSASAISLSELSLGGIKLGDTKEQVLTTLGPPVTQSPVNGVYDTKFKYPGMEIIFGSGAEIITSNSAQHCTPAGACPRISEELLTSLYGSGVRDLRPSEIVITYPAPGDACFLEAIVSQNEVRALTVLCQP